MKKFKIAAIVSNPCLADARVIKIAEAAAEMGHDVHVFATQGKDALVYEKKDNITYHRLEWNLSKQMKNTLFIKILAFFNKKLSIFVLKKTAPFFRYSIFKNIFMDSIVELNPDLIHAHDLITLPLGFHVAKECNAKLIYDAHELEVHRNPPLPFFQKRYVAYVEKKYGQKANDVIMVCQKASEVLANHLNRDDVHVVYNSPIIEPFTHRIKDDLKLDESTPLIIYVGKVSDGRGIEDTLELLPNLYGFHFATIGPCDVHMRKKFTAYARNLKVDKQFTILPPVHFKHVVEYIRGADIGVIVIATDTLSYRLTMPNKLQEMTFADIPIIAKEGLSEVKNYFDEIKNGKIIDFDKKEALSYTFTKFYEERENYKLTPEKEKFLQEKYSWDTQKKKLFMIYNRLLGE